MKVIFFLMRSGVFWKNCKNNGISQNSFEDICRSFQNYILNIVNATSPYKSKKKIDICEIKKQIKESFSECCSGNKGSRDVTIEIIKIFIRMNCLQNLYEVIPMEDDGSPKTDFIFEKLIYLEELKNPNEGFANLVEKAGWADKKGEQIVIRKEDITEAWEKYGRRFSDAELIDVLAEYIYAETMGLGKIDTLNVQRGIEEIQIGMSGVFKTDYDYRRQYYNVSKETSNESIYVMFHGKKMRMHFMAFKSEEELKRVIRNLVINADCGELSVLTPMIVADTEDGRRISVSRPPATETWVAIIRKFDDRSIVKLERLYEKLRQGEMIALLLSFLVKSGMNIAITGEMASGKTTMFRALLEKVGNDKNIRIIEHDAFELNIRDFLPQSNVLTLRVSKTTKAAEIFSFVKKTTGQVFGIGEISSHEIASVAVDISKFASQLIFSAHYRSTEEMITDFLNAKLCVGGYTDERLAQSDILNALDFDVHLGIKDGVRYVEYINEIVRDNSEGKNWAYRINRIYDCGPHRDSIHILKKPDELIMDRVRRNMDEKEYAAFEYFMEKNMNEACTELYKK